MFQHVRSIDALIENYSDWSVLDGHLPDGWRMGDLDGFMERKGNIFIGEEKSSNAPYNKGQDIAHQTMHKLGYATIMVLWYDKEYQYDENGKPLRDTHGLHIFKKCYYRMKMYFPGEEPKTISLSPADEHKIVDFVKRWVSYANAHPYKGIVQ